MDKIVVVQDYQSYLKTRHWQKKKNFFKNSSKKRWSCNLCGSRRYVQLHHKQYRDENGSILYREKLKHLIPLCASCHRTWHYMHGSLYMTPGHIDRIKFLLAVRAPKKIAFQLALQPQAVGSIKIYYRSFRGKHYSPPFKLLEYNPQTFKHPRIKSLGVQ